MDLRQLREQTRAEHEATEAALPLGAPHLEMQMYKAALAAMLPVVEGWERWAEQNAPASVRPLLARRRRSHLLRQDLRALDVHTAENATDVAQKVDWRAVVTGHAAASAENVQFEAGFLGALYVMEGSTLGGRFIARHVESVLGLQPGHGDAYFRGHGEATGSMWRETTAIIEAVPEGDAALVIAAAKRTFAAFGAALRSGLQIFAVPERVDAL